MSIKLIQLPSKEVLAPLIKEALTEVSAKQFVINHLTGIQKMLEIKPSLYEHYGCYWWAIKELLIEHGLFTGLIENDKDDVVKNHFNYDDPVFLLCAAWAYHQDRIEQGVMNPALHRFEVEDDYFEYILEDMDMIAKVFNK